MGAPKALIPFEGVPLWRRQVSLLEALDPAELLISAGADWSPGTGPWTVVRDKTPGLGPLGGIAAALRAARTGLLLVLAVDMPSMTAGCLRSLAAAAGPHGIVPARDGLYEALSAVYPASILALAEESLGGGDRSMQRFVRRALLEGLVAAQPIPPHELPLFKNLNRPSDL
jgi:molybdopterin-guanine dinucleotide biosynthesis protein A